MASGAQVPCRGPHLPLPRCPAERDEWRGDTCPRFHILEGTCPNLVRTLPALPYDPVRVEDVDTKADDHVADAARYLMHSLSAGAGPVLYGEWADDGRGRRLTVEEMGGPTPLPMVAGSRYAGNMREGLSWDIDFSRTDGTTPGATKQSPSHDRKLASTGGGHGVSV